MKKHARLLCAILVLAMLCSALFFVAGAEETEPFKKSFEAVKYSGNKINDGQLVTSMDAVGNRVTSVTTMERTL